MLIEPAADSRSLHEQLLTTDLCVVGGGLAGICCAITAARAGAKVALMQDRPVLGGNGSSEIRLWLLGATCHMASNNRWAREGGVVGEIMVENLYRNPEGNALIVDTILLEKVTNEPNITLLLNTAAMELGKTGDRIDWVRGFCSQNSTMYKVEAPLFCDASGDGVVGFMSGAAFRMGAESADEFNERFAPTGEFGSLLGHSLYFYSKDVGQPVEFHAPAYALENVPDRIPRYKAFNAKTHGCHLWWIEHGGRLDTVHDTEAIKWELWKVVYGVWDYIKNSGEFPEAANLTLEWVGHIPGKRESRRFEGDYMLTQDDVISRKRHFDDVAFGGWSIDLHPADGVYSQLAGSHHLHSKGIYPIPYRCLYSRNVDNLFLAGRIISASHVAFGTTRVMCTCAHGGQAAGMAAKMCVEQNVLPRDIAEAPRIGQLQHRLLETGQHIPRLVFRDENDLARRATITASSTFDLASLPAGDVKPVSLERSQCQMLPMPAGRVPKINLTIDAAADVTVHFELRTTSDPHHHCPDITLAERAVEMKAGVAQRVTLDFDTIFDEPSYAFLIAHASKDVSIHRSSWRVTGLLATYGQRESDYTDVGGEKFDVFRPERRPGGQNWAMTLDPPIDAAWSTAMVTTGVQRPTHVSNAWVAATDDASPTLTLGWDAPQRIGRIELFFDVDHDHAMESVFFGHPERAVPFCVKRFRVLDGQGRELHACGDNHEQRRTVVLDQPIETQTLVIALDETWGQAPAALFEVRCYAS